MPVGVAKIDAPAAVPVIEFTVVEAPRRAAIGELRLANAPEDSIELGIADVEGIVVALELLVVIEKKRERVVDAYRCEMAVFRIGMKAENARKKLRRCPLVAGRNDGVVEVDGHRNLSLPTAAGYRNAQDRYQMGLAGRGVKGFARGRMPSCAAQEITPRPRETTGDLTVARAAAPPMPRADLRAYCAA